MKSSVVISPVDMQKRAAHGLKAGDTVRVWQKVIDLKKQKGANKKETLVQNTRRQAFEGLVLAVKHGTESGATFTVRKVSSGVGVEKIFPLYSPMIDDIEVLRRTRTRRSKLYFIREKAARDQKRAMRRQMTVDTRVAKDEPAAEAEAPQETQEVAAAE
jgi:large subunit ribosomal protein L19